MTPGSTSCPTCGKVVDPLRARSVGVRDGKVVAYCSAICASAAESRPVSVKIRTPASGIAVVIPTAPDSGPIIEIIREGSVPTAAPMAVDDSPSGKLKQGKHKQKGGKSKTSTPPAGAAIVAAPVVEAKSEPKIVPARRDHTPTPVELAKRKAELAAAEEADDDAMINGDDAPPARKLPLLLIAVIVIAVGGGVALVLKMLAKSGTAHAASVSEAWTAPASAPRVDPAPVAPAAPSPAAVVEQARGVLRAQLASGSPRVQRRAAAALARTADPAALDALAAALHDEPSEIARLDLAYALARGGDARGTTALVAALGAAQRRDVRAEAANQLARLGDARATPVLADYLDVSQLRVGAAEHLAYLAEPRALKLLEALRLDPRTSVDDRARATIALGVAGRVEVTADLRALLADARFDAFAASALAALHDPAARPVLVAQLAIPSLRTDAARALRRLEPELDAAPLLPPLVAALASAKDTDAAQAAEAVMLLAGPVAWSKYE